METPLLPANSWKKILPYIKRSGEGEYLSKSDIGDDFEFLENLGIFDDQATGELSSVGRALFESIFIRCDGKDKEILSSLLLKYPPTTVIQQYLWGISDVRLEQVLSVLKSTGFWIYESQEPLTHFLDLLNYAGLIKYDRKKRQIVVLASPDTEVAPQNIFIDPSRPFSNIIWVKKILGECTGYIYWLDKHFQKEALDWLWAVADSNKIKEIKILSLDLGEKNLGIEARKYYKRFKQELSSKGVSVVWATIDSKLVRDNHDRWIIGKNYLRNVPNVNAISSGQKSEMNQSNNHDQALDSFNNYFKQAKEVV